MVRGDVIVRVLAKKGKGTGVRVEKVGEILNGSEALEWLVKSKKLKGRLYVFRVKKK